MAEWQVLSLEVPPEIQYILDDVADVVSSVATFLDLVAAALDVLSKVLLAALDIYTAIVNALIDSIQAFLNDIQNAGIYVLVDYPASLSVDDVSLANSVSLSGTVLDPEEFTSGAVADADFQAIASKRKSWSKQQKAQLSYRGAINRVTSAFADPLDHLKPEFSEEASTYGVVLMGYSEDLATFFNLLRNFGNVFSILDLDQVLNPGLGTMIDGIEGSLADAVDNLDNIDFCQLNLSPSVEFRSAGQAPNFLGRYTIGDILPGLGELLTELSNLIEILRPNGGITEYIAELISAIQAKVKRLQDLAQTLEDLAEGLRSGLDGMKMASVIIESSTGNNGFVTGLKNSTGHPEFDKAYVVSVLLYAGGHNAEPLRLLFGNASGTPLSKSFQANLEREESNKTKPLLPP